MAGGLKQFLLRGNVVDLAVGGGTLTDAQKSFRDAWLSSKVK